VHKWRIVREVVSGFTLVSYLSQFERYTSLYIKKQPIEEYM